MSVPIASTFDLSLPVNASSNLRDTRLEGLKRILEKSKLSEEQPQLCNSRTIEPDEGPDGP